MTHTRPKRRRPRALYLSRGRATRGLAAREAADLALLRGAPCPFCGAWGTAEGRRVDADGMAWIAELGGLVHVWMSHEDYCPVELDP